MVQTLLDGLGPRSALTLHHVNFRLSRNNADVGHWRPMKIFRTIALALSAIAVRVREGCDTLYYIPAPPAKRGALYRDWVVLALCRPFFRRLVLHWHAAGLGVWLETKCGRIERAVTHALLGRADLSIVLAPSLRDDAEYLRARRIAIVANGIADPGPPPVRDSSRVPFQALFLGLCSEEKGLFAAAEAVAAANRRAGAVEGGPRFALVAAGPFPEDQTAARFHALAASQSGAIRHAGFAGESEKRRLFAASQCLIFPTHYSAEGLPLVVIEALAHDVPVIATRWRALPDIVSSECGTLVTPHDLEALTDALIALQRSPPRPGGGRECFLRRFTVDHHLDALAAALRELELPSAKAPPAAGA